MCLGRRVLRSNLSLSVLLVPRRSVGEICNPFVVGSCEVKG